eukprot:scaffold154408_cov28-Tisochrysis_lutea.AAC.2
MMCSSGLRSSPSSPSAPSTSGWPDSRRREEGGHADGALVRWHVLVSTKQLWRGALASNGERRLGFRKLLHQPVASPWGVEHDECATCGHANTHLLHEGENPSTESCCGARGDTDVDEQLVDAGTCCVKPAPANLGNGSSGGPCKIVIKHIQHGFAKDRRRQHKLSRATHERVK